MRSVLWFASNQRVHCSLGLRAKRTNELSLGSFTVFETFTVQSTSGQSCYVFVYVLCILADIEPFQQKAHVNKLSACEKGHSIRCLLYFQSSTFNIFKYKWKYLLRRILHASRGNSNPVTLSRINKRTFSYQWGFTSSYQRNRISPR